MLQHGGISRTLCYMKYVTKGHTVYDSTYMRYLEQSNSQKTEWWLPGPEGIGVTESYFKFTEYRVSVGQDKRVLAMDRGDGCTVMGVC